MNKKKYNIIESKKAYKFPTLENKKVLVIGIGGGSDVVGAYGISSFLKDKNPNAEIIYGVSVSTKNNYSGYEKLSEYLYRRKAKQNNQSKEKLHHTLTLVLKMQEFANESAPLLIVRPKYDKNTLVEEHQSEVAKIFENTLEIIKPDIIFAVDGGGDSLTGGVSSNVETEFDRTGIRALQKYGKPFTYIVLGVGCDGESTINMIKEAVLLENINNSLLGLFDLDLIIEKWSKISSALLNNDRTPNIMRLANDEIKNNISKSDDLVIIQRHRKPKIPLKWLKTGLAFDGLKFTGKYKE